MIELLVTPCVSSAMACTPREEAGAVGVPASQNGSGTATSGLFYTPSHVDMGFFSVLQRGGAVRNFLPSLRRGALQKFLGGVVRCSGDARLEA